MGYFIRFIKNRDLATEDIITTYIRSRFILEFPSGAVESLLRRLEAQFKVAETSMHKIPTMAPLLITHTHLGTPTVLNPTYKTL
jgi:hypothetical protein